MAVNWRAAILLGLASSSFSTLISQLAAARIGRDALIDWMTVANIPLRDMALNTEPTAGAVAIGILFHQWADFSWALFFFGALGRWTAGLRPAILLILALPWGAFTSATEWFLLVPLLPFWQPIFPLEQPYWIGFLVHFSSALIYPLYPWIRDRVAGRQDRSNTRFAGVWASCVATGVIVIGVLAYFGAQGYELPWHGHDEARDRAFVRRMSAHHAQGIRVAAIATDRATDPHLRALAHLIAAEQIGENRIFEQWARSWFDGTPEICSEDEKKKMPGMLSEAQIDMLRHVEEKNFDRLFVDLMTFHHLGAVKMADDEFQSDGDLRLRIMAHSIRHGQQGEIELMHGTQGIMAVRAATLDMFSARLTFPSYQ
jgi:uncharacterized protein (DUF305 family)